MHASKEILTETMLTVKDVAEILCIGTRTVWRWVDEGKLPKPIHFNRVTVRWKASEIQAYLDQLQSS